MKTLWRTILQRNCYNPSSSCLEKRDVQYCKAMQSVPTLKSLRIYSIDDDDEDDFCGFIQEDAKNHGEWVKRQVANLESAQEVMDEYIAAEPAGADAFSSCIPEPAPLDESIDYPSDIEDIPVGCEFPINLLYLIPDPVKDSEGDLSNDDIITYSIRETATKSGNSVIEDSHGFTYSYQRQSKGDPPKLTYWLCIKRQWKNTDNCTCSLKIKNYHEGQDNMIVTRKKHHNHEQDFANIIRKDLTDELKRCAVDFPKTKTVIIVDKVLKENADFQSFFENGSTMLTKKSMTRAVQRARKSLKPPAIKTQILN